MSDNTFNVVCDKCKSYDISCSTERGGPLPTDMSDFNPTKNNLIYYQTTYKMKCNNCGYEYEVTR